MRRRHFIPVLALLFFPAIPSSHAQENPAPSDAKPHLKILAEEPRLIILAGGAQLTRGADGKRFIDLVQRHYDNKCPHQFEVVEAKEGKKAKFNAKNWAEAVWPALTRAKGKNLPIVVLAHLPPLVTKPSGDLLIRDAKDVERIKAYGDVFAEYAQTLRKHGADLVVLGLEGAVGPDKSNPKAAGTFAHLRLVSDEIANRSLPGIVVGPRVFQTFDKHRHLYKKKDHHITEDGRVVISQLWFQALCDLDGVAVPAWSQKALAELLKK